MKATKAQCKQSKTLQQPGESTGSSAWVPVDCPQVHKLPASFLIVEINEAEPGGREPGVRVEPDMQVRECAIIPHLFAPTVGPRRDEVHVRGWEATCLKNFALDISTGISRLDQDPERAEFATHAVNHDRRTAAGSRSIPAPGAGHNQGVSLGGPAAPVAAHSPKRDDSLRGIVVILAVLCASPSVATDGPAPIRSSTFSIRYPSQAWRVTGHLHVA